MTPPVIRDTDPGDLESIQAIYAREVLYGLASFEEEPPSVQQMAVRHAEIVRGGFPFLTAELNGMPVGYAYASRYRARPAYRYTLEDSVYVAEGARGRGVGAALLAALVTRCEAGPWRQLVAVIGDSANTGSIILHERLGFGMVGTLRAVGFKQGRWIDTVIMQRPLGAGAETVPTEGTVVGR